MVRQRPASRPPRSGDRKPDSEEAAKFIDGANDDPGAAKPDADAQPAPKAVESAAPSRAQKGEKRVTASMSAEDLDRIDEAGERALAMKLLGLSQAGNQSLHIRAGLIALENADDAAFAEFIRRAR